MMILGVVALIAIYFLFIKKKDKDDKESKNVCGVRHGGCGRHLLQR